MPDADTRRIGVFAPLVLTVVAMAGACRPAADPVGPPKHLVLISIDTCRADHLGCYGAGRGRSPNIDAVARDGVVFTRAHSTNPITLPAHGSMLTGTNPPWHGVHNNHGYRLDPSNRTLAEILEERGFETAAFVSAPVLEARFGLDQGFDVYDDRTEAFDGGIHERRAEATSEAAIRWLQDRGEQPFFLFVHFFDPHLPYVPPEPFASRDPDSPYAAEIAYADHGVGQVIRALKSQGLYDSTLLVITSDHGESLGEHGEATHSFFVYDSTLRVPLVIRSPDGKRSARVDEPAGIVDIVPTVLGLLQIDTPAELHGADLSSWIRGGGSSVARDLYFESLVPAEYGCSPLRGLVSGDWKFIWSARSELYDLARDPQERDDRLAARPDVVEAMQTRLRVLLDEQRRSDVADDGTGAVDPETLERLQALGYAGGRAALPDPSAEPSGEDPKDFIDVLNRLLRADELRARGELAAARDLCLQIQRERPGELRSLQILGDVALLEGNGEQAVDYYSRFLAAASVPGEQETAGRQRQGFLAEVHYNLGSALHRLQRLDAAAAQFEQALALQPDLATAHNALGAILAQQGKLRESVERFRRALDVDPTLQSARDNLALALARLESRGVER